MNGGGGTNDETAPTEETTEETTEESMDESTEEMTEESDTEESELEEELLEAANADEFEISTDGKTLIKYKGNTTEVTIPDGVEKIGNNAFSGNKTITTVTFPSSVTEIGTQAFMECTSLKSVTLNDGLTKIEQQAFCKVPFGDGNKLGTLTIPATVSQIGVSAFEGCEYLGTVIFASGAAPGVEKTPDDTLSTGNAVFDGCKNLKSVTLPNRLTNIATTMFRNCTSLETVTFGNRVTEIEDKAFENCGLLEVKLPLTVTAIGDHAFLNCTKLKNVELNDGLQKIGANAFQNVAFGEKSTNGQEVLGTLTIPATVTEIGMHAFLYDKYPNTSYLGEVVFADGSGQLNADGNNMQYAFKGCTKLKKVTLPNRLKVIPDSMFFGCSSLENVAFGNQLQKIMASAFNGCGLLAVTLPSTVTEIGNNAFQNCTKLKTVILNDGLGKIGENAFDAVPFGDENALGTLTIPATVTTIGQYAFQGNNNNSGTTYLEKVIFADDTAEGSGKQPAASLSTEDDDMTRAFHGHENLKEVTLPQRLTAIPDYMFWQCTKLEKVKFGDKVTEIRNSAFQECGLPEIILPSTIQTIGGYAFRDCKNLKSVKLNEGLETISGSAFMQVPFGDDKTPGKLRIPGSVTTIEASAFDQCAYLKEVVFANTTAKELTIGSGIFSSCPRLETVILPERLKSLSKDFIYYEPKLATLYIPESVTTIADGAISETPKLTIYGKKDSAAEVYANKNRIPFSTNDMFNNTLKVQFASNTASQDVSLAVSANDGAFGVKYFNVAVQFSLDADIKIKLTLTKPDAYIIESVKIGSTTLKGTLAEEQNSTAYIYDVTFTNRAATVMVKLRPKPKTVTIKKSIATTANLADPVVTKVTNKVTPGAKQTIDGNYVWNCDLENGATELKFTVKATDVSCKPIVTYDAEPTTNPTAVEPAQEPATPPKKTAAPIKVTDIAKPQATEYTYTISVESLKDGGGITIAQESDIKQTVTLTNADLWAKAYLTVSQNGGAYDPKSDEVKARTVGGNIVYEVLRGRELTIRADQKANVTLKSLSYTIGTATKPKTATARGGMAEIVLPDIRDNVNITIVATGGYAQSLKETDTPQKEVTAVKNIYNVSYSGKYTASAKQSWKDSDNDVVFTKAELFAGTNKSASYTWTSNGTNTQNVLSPAAENKGINIDIEKLGDNREKKKWTLKLYDDNDIAATYTLQVYKPITKVNIKSTSISQPTDTQKTYPLTTDGELAKLKDAFTVEAKDKGADTKNVVTAASINEKGELLITTGNTLGEATVTLTPKEGYTGAIGKTITVKTTKMLEKTKLAPSVACVSDDISLTFALTSKNVPTPAVGKIYYEIKADAKTDTKGQTNVPANLETSRTVYVERTDDSQRYRLIMQKLAQDAQPTLGQGGKYDYNVTVRLVYTNSAITDKDLNDDGSAKEGIIGTYSGTSTDEISGKAATKTFSTLAPAYEAKLQLTKGTTTVYTGQTNVLVATAKFDKKTTFTSIKNTVDADGNLGATVDTVTGKITVSPKEGMAPGKYSIVVTADEDSANNMVPSTAKIDITVVKGIKELKVDIPTESLYKASKKTATIKPTVIYNEGDVAPKTKKVEWSITDKDGKALADGSYLKKMLSINKTSGVVTVNKDFVLSKTEANNQFTITASARDFKNFGASGNKTDNPVFAKSEIITITNKITDITAIGLVKQKADKSGYEIVALSSNTATLNPKASDIHGTQLVAFKTAIAANATIAEGDLSNKIIPAENLSFTSNAKTKIAVDGDGNIAVTTPCKVKLTVAATDGSGKKKDMTVDVSYDEATTLKLKAAQFTGTYVNGVRQYGSSNAFIGSDNVLTYNQNGIGATLFKLTVTGDNAAAPAFANYTVAQGSGTKILYKDGNDIYIATTAKDAKVTFQNKGASRSAEKKKVYTYMLKNDSWGAKAAPKVTSGQKIYAYGGTAENYATLLPDAKALAKLPSITEDNLRAYVEIDWSKRTDKNEAALRAIAEKMTLGELQILEEKQNNKTVKYIKLAAKEEIKPDSPLIPGTYDFKVTFGKLENNTFTAVTPPTAAKVTITAAKTVTFTPNGSYKIEKDKGSVAITMNTRSTNAVADELGTVTYTLLNANVGGKANEFTDYFEISGNSIKVKTGKTLDGIDKADLTGYLSYEATTTKGYCTNKTVTGVVKVTLAVKK